MGLRRLLTKEEATLYLQGVESSYPAYKHEAYDVRWSPFRQLRADGAIDITCRDGCVHTVRHDEVRRWLANPPPPRREEPKRPPSQFRVLRSQLVEFARRLAAEQFHPYEYWYGDPDPRQLASDAADRARAETKADIGKALLEALGEEES